MKLKISLAMACLVGLGMTSAHAQDIFDSDGDAYKEGGTLRLHDNDDNCTLTANPLQRDTDGDYMGNMCDPDFNNDGIINFDDLGIMAQNFFAPGDIDTDLDGNSLTNFADLTILAEQFFGTPGPTATDPDQPPCDCYFSGDCNDGDPDTPQMFCYYGPGSYTVEDNCVWRNIKPDGSYGAGCSIETNLTTGAWIPSICDGVCTTFNRGSAIGNEQEALVAQTVSLWGQAMLQPSVAGGGVVDAELAAAASAVQFDAQNVPMMLGRHAADALAMAAGEPFHNYFCHWEGHPDDADAPVVDLSGDTCRIRAGELTIEALASAIQTPGTAAGIMEQIMDVCSDWQNMFGTQCDSGPGALKCAVDFIEAQAYFLRTAPVQPYAAPDPIQDLLGSVQR